MKRNLVLPITILGVLLLGTMVLAAGAYDRLDDEKLGRQLRKMQMNTMLEELAQQTGDFTRRIEAMTARANTVGKTSETERDKILAQGADLVLAKAEKYREELKQYDKNSEKYEDATIKYYKTYLQYFNIAIAQRAGLHFNRIEYLIGNQGDRKKVLGLVKEAGTILARESKKLNALIKKSRDNAILMSYLVPELEKIQLAYRYQEAQILFYNAMVQPALAPVTELDVGTGQYVAKLDANGQPIMGPNPKIAGSLHKAITDIKPFAEDSQYGVQPQSTLLLGRCYTELGQYDKAATIFELLKTIKKVSPAYIVQGMFAIFKNNVARAENTIVQQKDTNAGDAEFVQAKSSINEYLVAFAKTQSPLTVDFRRLAMEYYLYDSWGEALRKVGDKSAAKCDKKIQQAFMGFLNEHKNPAVQAQVAEVFSGRLSMTDGDTSGMSPVIVLILATTKIDQAQQLQGDVPLNDLPAETRQQVTQTREMAIQMLEGIRKDDSPAAATAKPQALWKLGVLYVQQLDNLKAMDAFRELAKDFPDNENALDAAMNAVNIGAQLIQMREQQGQEVAWETREEYIESLQRLLTNWPNDKRAAEYHFDLAWQCGQMAGLDPDRAVSKWYPEAVKNYGMVPADSTLYDRALFESLELQFFQLIDSPKTQARKDQAEALKSKLLKFGEMAHSRRRTARDEKQKSDMGDWGSKSEFYAWRLANEILGQGSEASSKIELLPSRWANTEILETARAYAIENRVKLGDVGRAIEQLKSFEKQYGLAKTGRLTDTVVDALRNSITKLSEDGSDERKLKQYRDDYLRFAQQIYDADGKSSDLNTRWRATVLLGDSLVQSGTEPNATRALELFQGLAGIEKQKLTAERKKIDDYINAQLTAVKDLQNNPADVKKIKDILDEAFKHFGVSDWNSNSRWIAKRSIENLGKIDPKAEKQQYDKLVRQVIVNANRALESLRGRMSKSAGTIDPIVILGIGNANQLLGNYEKAIASYHQLVKGGLDLNDPTQRVLYWEAQLGLCQCSFELARGDAAKQKQLSFYISQLSDSYPDLGGNRFRGKLRAIEIELKQNTK